MGSVEDAVATFSSPKDSNLECSSSSPNAFASECFNKPKLLYREQGEMIMPNKDRTKLKFYREYLYKFSSDTEADVYFYQPGNESEHLKFFHHVGVNDEGINCTEHLCIADIYKVDMKFLSEEKLSMKWRVKGPQKDYAIETLMVKEKKSNSG